MSQVIFVQEKKNSVSIAFNRSGFTLKLNPNSPVDFWKISYLHLIFFLCKIMLNMAILIPKYDVNYNKN